MDEYKPVHFNLFRPEKSIFKHGKNERAEIQIVSCCNSDNCQLFAQKECACRYGLYGGTCPYGKLSRHAGFTQRASKYFTWCKEKKEKYAGVDFLRAPKMLGAVGDYVFLPYPHMEMLKELPWEGNFLKRDDFTVGNIIKLVRFQPQALFGGEIKSYQKKVPPLFLKHLSEQMPELFSRVVHESAYASKRFEEHSDIGRKAILETTTPNAGQFRDIHGALWTWDGETLSSTNSKASFMLVSGIKKIVIVPKKKQIVAITDDKQVNRNTVFTD